MADPKLEVEQRFDRIERAIRAMAFWTLQNKDSEAINKILRGEGEEANATER